MEMAALLRTELSQRGIDTGSSNCQIVPIGFEREELACRFYQILADRGVLSAVFLSPAVPLGKGVVRFSTHCELEPTDVANAADAAAVAMDELGIERKAKREAA